MVEKYFVVALAVDPGDPSLGPHLLCLEPAAKAKHRTSAASGGSQACPRTQSGRQLPEEALVGSGGQNYKKQNHGGGGCLLEGP